MLPDNTLSHPCLTENVLRHRRDLSCLTPPYRGETETRVSRETLQKEGIELDTKCDFILRLHPLTTGWLTPPTQRLRLALKCLGRGFGLRTVSCKPVVSTTAQPSTDEK